MRARHDCIAASPYGVSLAITRPSVPGKALASFDYAPSCKQPLTITRNSVRANRAYGAVEAIRASVELDQEAPAQST